MDMGIIDRMLNHFGYELYVKPVDEILDSKKRKEFENYPWIYRAHIRKQITNYSKNLESDLYGIGTIISAATNRDGIPLPHLKNRMLDAKKLMKYKKIERIQIGNRIGILANNMTSYLVNELGIPNLDIDTLYGGWGTAGELLRSRENVEQMVKDGSISKVPYFYVITTDWAKKRTETISDWILRGYGHEVIGSPDGRIEWIKRKTEKMVKNGEITENKALEWVKTVRQDVKNDSLLEKSKIPMYNILSKISLIIKNSKLLDISEFLLGALNPHLLWIYGKEFSKRLVGKEIYQISEDIYKTI